MPKQRNIRPHRHTLVHHTHKNTRLSLTITITHLRPFQVSNNGRTITSRQSGFTVRLHAHQNLNWLDIQPIRFVPVKAYGKRAPLHHRQCYLLVQVVLPEPMILEPLDIRNPEDILGVDRSTKNH